ncbi:MULTISPECIES: sulfatase [unclassified Carboxylicivirga]|uniref:sulfatase n=1 Tax=Carboxylicivirga TaxID=1628153 RepID=UPI003D3359E7
MNFRNLKVALIGLSSLLIACSPKTDKMQSQPNVLFILADDLGYRDLGFMGSDYYETPNLDQLAREGVVFTNGYAGCQVCSPSRASIMTGKFPARHGITDWIGAPSGENWRNIGRYNKLLPAEYEHALPAAYTTLPEALKEAGYTTFFAGKWHLGGEGSWPQDHGFDVNIGGWHAGSPIGGYFDPYQNPNLPNRKPGENLSMRLARETVDFLAKNNSDETGQPVFAFLSFYAVHGPIQTTPEKWAKYQAKAKAKGLAEKAYEMGHFLPIRQVQDNPVYAGLVESMDDAIGYVTASLKKMGLDDNTIVIFTSDNGGVASGDSYSTANLPLRGGKGYQFEGGIREPYVIKVPGMERSVSSCDVPVSGTDFYPTILELVGADLRPEAHNDGVSLVPLLKGERIAERSLIWHYPHYGNQGGEPSSIIRKGDWKLIYYYEDEYIELYNLGEDLEEQYNLASRHPEKATSLQNELFTYLDEVGARYPQKDPQYDAEKEQAYLKGVHERFMPQLEQQRLRYLNDDYEPNSNWWGSKVND